MHNNVVDADRGVTESDFITVAGLILAAGDDCQSPVRPAIEYRILSWYLARQM
ncbi:hypothetical protein ACU5JM_00725 (plasmid) [Rhodococcus erythropolis]|uniref:hypothetical protein n=1 Tax=Rhodococcus erythropolis TaxID=1833 RepID=UPI00406BB455